MSAASDELIPACKGAQRHNPGDGMYKCASAKRLLRCNARTVPLQP